MHICCRHRDTPGFEPGSHWWEASALTTTVAPMHACSPPWFLIVGFLLPRPDLDVSQFRQKILHNVKITQNDPFECNGHTTQPRGTEIQGPNYIFRRFI